MTFNKLNNLIDKYNLTNILKVCIILLVLYLVARVFIPTHLVNDIIPVIVENFDNTNESNDGIEDINDDYDSIEGIEDINNGINDDYDSNEISLKKNQHTPSYFDNTCILELDDTYQVNTLKFKFSNGPSSYNNKHDIYIQFQDNNGNMKYIKSTSNKSIESPQNFKSIVTNSIVTLQSITDENDLPVFTSKLILTIGDSSNNISSFKDSNGNGYIKEFNVSGRKRKTSKSTTYNVLAKKLSKLNFGDTSSSSMSANLCPNINVLANSQNTTQKICDNLEFQDKTKSEKLRLERNKQYLLKLKNQQEQIDQLNNVIQTLETQRENRALTSDKARVLQYQKQAEDASVVRDLANQRLMSQENNQLYLDVKINKS